MGLVIQPRGTTLGECRGRGLGDDSIERRDITCTAPVESTAATLDEIVRETRDTRITERGATRLDDQTNDASMELRKKAGYF